MNRTTAIVITVVTVLLCGCPGLVLVILGVLAAIGAQLPEVMAQNAYAPQDVLIGAVMYLCFGGVLILIPVLVGFLSIRYAKPSEPGINEPIPPAS